MKNFIAICLVCLFFSACAQKVIKEPVLIPTKCDVQPPKSPAPLKDNVENLRNILIYTKTLERDLHYCIGLK